MSIALKLYRCKREKDSKRDGENKKKRRRKKEGEDRDGGTKKRVRQEERGVGKKDKER